MNKLILKEINNLIRESSSGVDVMVDIQPEYMSAITFLGDWIKYLNENASSKRIIILYNGADTVGGPTEDEYINWLLENGLEEEIVYELEFFDKGYAFFRTPMDSGVDFDEILIVLKFMVENDYNDVRDITDEEWVHLKNEHNLDNIHENIIDNDGGLYIPDVMEYLDQLNNITLMGGGVDECLAEIELVLQLLDKPYHLNKRFIY